MGVDVVGVGGLAGMRADEGDPICSPVIKGAKGLTATGAGG